MLMGDCPQSLLLMLGSDCINAWIADSYQEAITHCVNAASSGSIRGHALLKLSTLGSCQDDLANVVLRKKKAHTFTLWLRFAVAYAARTLLYYE